MAILPRPVSPRNALADLKMMFSRDREHRWTFLALSAAITGLLLWGFYLDARSPKKERQIIYVESWMADRKDSEIIRRQIIDLGKYEAALASKQQEFQRLADKVGIEWRADEAKNRERRAEMVKAMEKHLDKKLAESLAREAAEGKAKAPASTTAN
jgi:hypothetical protein